MALNTIPLPLSVCITGPVIDKLAHILPNALLPSNYGCASHPDLLERRPQSRLATCDLVARLHCSNQPTSIAATC